MLNARMLYKSPGIHKHQDGTFEYLIVDDQDAPKHIKDGWFLTTAEALDAAKEQPKEHSKLKAAK